MLIEGIDILTILFELTVFALFFIFVSNIFTNYILPMLYLEIEQSKQHEKDLKDKGELLDLSKNSLETKIKEQEESLFVLSKKVELWKDSLIQKNNEIKKQNTTVLQAIKEKRKIQEANQKVSKMEKIVIPQAISLAYKEIEESFSGKKGEELLKELVIKIEPK
jgi:hypothetical protein